MMKRRDFFAAAAAATTLRSKALNGVELGKISTLKELADLPENVLHSIEVDGQTVSLFSIEAAMAEGKPEGPWRRLKVVGLIGSGTDGHTYWQENADSPWERCGK